MVTVLPGERTPFDILGRDLGRSLQSVLPGAVNQGFQRQQGLNAIDQLQGELASANGDMSKILPALARAYTLNPSLERSGLGQQYLQQSIAQGQNQALGQAAGVEQPLTRQYDQPDQSLIQPISEETQQPQPQTASKSEPRKASSDIDSIANQYLGEIRPDLVNPATQYGAIATFDSELKQDLTPQEEAELRQQLLDKYKNPNIINPVVDRIREGVKNKYNESLAKYGFDKEKLGQIQKKWNDFTQGSEKRLQPHIGKYGEEFPRTQEVLTNKYNQYAGALPVNMTPEQMHTNSMALLQNDINKLDALHALPAMPPLRTQKDAAEYIDANKKAYKELADLGFTEALKEDAFLNKDLGNEEFHSLIWGDQTDKKTLNSIHDFKAPEEYKQVGGAPQGQTRYNSNYPREQKKYVNDISNQLKKLKPEDDLILARAMVLDSGGTVKDFTDALSLAQENGLKLSQFQQSQIQEAHIPRRPPLWEIFSDFSAEKGGPVAGVFQGLNWKPFINYLRGKK